MKTNEIFTHILNKYFDSERIKGIKDLDFLDQLSVLWAVFANKILVVKVDKKEYQLTMSFIELSRGLGKLFFKTTKKYIRTEFFVHSIDPTLRYDEDEDIKAATERLHALCDVVGIYEVEYPPFSSRYGFAPYVWINFKTKECRYYARRIRKGKIASIAHQISMEQYDDHVDKIAATFHKPTRKSNGTKKKTVSRK
jgi:hypothetical protein